MRLWVVFIIINGNFNFGCVVNKVEIPRRSGGSKLKNMETLSSMKTTVFQLKNGYY